MKNHSKHFRVKPNESVKLAKRPTRVVPFYKSKASLRRIARRTRARTGKVAGVDVCPQPYSVLVIFQGHDAAGKDGAIAHVLSGLNPEGCQVYSFKQPSPEELAHDFSGGRPAACRSADTSAFSSLVL